MSSYDQFVREFVQVLQEGKKLPYGGAAGPGKPELPQNAPKVLVFSPHPDDEVIVGALPLRLLRQGRMKVVNVAVTQGSNKARQPERWNELSACCNYIGFGLIQTSPGGLEGINVKNRKEQPAEWGRSVDRVAEIVSSEQPKVICFPHAKDWNTTHIGTHYLVRDALARLGAGFSCYTVETEFWGAMDDPNLMVESSEADVKDLLTALSFHVGEIQRNPYHLRLPAWLIDNVRRGGELVGGQGGAAPDFNFATLYRLRRWEKGRFGRRPRRNTILSQQEEPGALFP